MDTATLNVSTGKAHPLGARVTGNGVNFSILSQDATAVELLLFARPDDAEPAYIVKLDPVDNRTFHFWHVFIENVKPGTAYAYRVNGPYDPGNGYRFNKNKVLLDPYAFGNVNDRWDRGKSCNDEDNLAFSMRSIVIDVEEYNWENDIHPNIPLKDTIVYEMHVGGFTRDKSSEVKNPGTFLGIIEKIPYLKKLGITAVELLPVFEFDEKEIFKYDQDGRPLINYWGYSTLGFLAPHSPYCVAPQDGAHLDEFRDMVKALHKEGIEVILDVVFNHTTEGNEQGPVIHFKGIDNKIYYFLSPDNPYYYMNYSGCGNTVNCNHPIVEKFIIDCLEFWVDEMHVDGFRFDEGSILSRGEDGKPLMHPPVLWELELSDVFANTKLIAEAWDADGLYQIGGFPGYRWGEWNGKFRDDIRRFVKGDAGMVSALASRIAGSNDIYQHSRHSPLNSINFVACHDGFTMMDLVSYNYKHNEANGENNQDGINENLSWNCGVEGPTDDADINRFRVKQIKNFFTLLMLSRGIPMFLSGDEVGKSQSGNNNVYCQNNSISWFNWNLPNTNKELLRFVQHIIAFRRENALLRKGEFFTGDINERGFKDIEWHGCRLYAPGWADPSSKSLAFTLGAFEKGQADIHVMLNADYIPLEFDIPPGYEKMKWYRLSDTSLDAPVDFADNGREEPVSGQKYMVNPYSSVILILK